MPGVVSARSRKASRLVGILVSSSWSIRESIVDDCVSTIGPSAVTLTVSLTAPTARTKSSVTVASADTSMFSRTVVLNPASDTVTVYRPMGRFRMTYVPVADVVADRVRMSDGLETSTVAPGSTAPSPLATVPVSLPSWMACAKAGVAQAASQNREAQERETRVRAGIAITLPFA